MTIYKKRTHHCVYRRIYKQHYGSIPKDEDGRSFDIHHIDGDATNNEPTNLVALSVKDHYALHNAQGDWAACLRLSKVMSLSPEEKSRLAKLAVQSQLDNGTHPFATRKDGTSLAQDRVKAGTNPFLKRMDGSSVSGDQKKDPNYKNPFSKRADGSSVGSDLHKKPGYINPFSTMVGDKHRRFDPIIYNLYNKNTGISANMTQRDFVKYTNCDPGSVSRLVRGIYKSFKGWILVS